LRDPLSMPSPAKFHNGKCQNHSFIAQQYLMLNNNNCICLNTAIKMFFSWTHLVPNKVQNCKPHQHILNAEAFLWNSICNIQFQKSACKVGRVYGFRVLCSWNTIICFAVWLIK
jgi:hypothetical protein